MRFLTSNLFFAAFVILGVGMLLWLVFNDSSKQTKNTILSRFMDLVLIFVGLLFAMNILFHFLEIINDPYRILLFSSDVVALSTLVITIYSTLKYGKKLLKNQEKALGVGQLLILLGLVNHLYLYIIYRDLRSLLFIVFFIGLLGLTTVKHKLPKMDGLVFIALIAMSHLLLMGQQSIVYFNFTFYRMPLLIISITLIGILFVQRRSSLSKLN